MLIFRLPVLDPEKCFLPLLGTRRRIPATGQMFAEAVSRAGNPLDPDYRGRFIRSLEAEYASETAVFLSAWLKDRTGMTPEQAVRLVASLAVKSGPEYAVLFFLSAKKHSPALAEVFAAAVRPLLGERPDVMLHFLLSLELNRPCVFEHWWLPGEVRTLLEMLVSVTGTKWHVVSMIESLIEELGANADAAAVALLANPRPTGLRAVMNGSEDLSSIMGRLLNKEEMGLQAGASVVRLLAQAARQSRPQDRKTLRVLAFFMQEINLFSGLRFAVGSCNYDRINSLAAELSQRIRKAGFKPSDLADVGLPYGSMLTAEAGGAVLDRDETEPGLPLSDETAAFLEAIGMAPQAIREDLFPMVTLSRS